MNNNTTLYALIYDAWFKDIEPEDVCDVLQSEGIDIDLDTIRKLYSKWYDSEVHMHILCPVAQPKNN